MHHERLKKLLEDGAADRAAALQYWRHAVRRDDLGAAKFDDDDVPAALGSDHVGSITHVRLVGTSWDTRHVEALSQNGWPERLEVLDLYRCAMSRDGLVALFASEWPALRELTLGHEDPPLASGRVTSRAERARAAYTAAFEALALPSLRRLCMGPEAFQDDVLEVMAAATCLGGLEHLGISRDNTQRCSANVKERNATPLPDTGWHALFNSEHLEGLRSLDLSGLFTRGAPRTFASLGPLTECPPLPKLDRLILEQCRLSRRRAQELHGWSQLHSTRVLSLRRSLVELLNVVELLGTEPIEALEELDLSHCLWDSRETREHGLKRLLDLQLPNLRVLRLQGCGLNAKALRDIARMTGLPKLEVLDLRDNPIGAGGRALATSKNFPELQRLLLHGCRLSTGSRADLADNPVTLRAVEGVDGLRHWSQPPAI